MRRAIFSEGRGLCAPHWVTLVMPRHVALIDWYTKGRWPKGGNIWIGLMPVLGACGAVPPGARVRRAWGAGPWEIDRKGLKFYLYFPINLLGC